MIYLYTLPGVAFNAPNISVPLIKGYLEQNNILSNQKDLSIEFFKKCVNSSYINKKLPKNYISLSQEEKQIIKNIDKTISVFKTKKLNSKKIIKANADLLKYLNIYSNCFNINWTRKGLDFKVKMNTIDDVLDFAFKKNNDLFDSVLKIQKGEQKNIYYLSIQFPFQLPYAIRFAKKIKNNNPSSKVIFGGDYITHIVKNADELMNKCDCIDGIILFGEYKYLIDLIEYFNDNHDINIPNTIIKRNNKVEKNRIINCTKYKKDLYVPSFNDLNLEDYISNLKLIPLTLNYGCYHSKCNFCSRYFYYNGYSKYDLDKIFMLIKKMYQEQNIEAIYFVDECVPPEILIKVANFLIENNIKIKWMVETRIDSKLLDNKVAELLYKSGCREISFGIESYNKRILEDMNKQIDLNIAKKVMKNFYETGISVSATFMIGYPTKNIFNIFRTLRFITKFKYIDTFGLGIFSYMRNSKIINDSKLNEEEDLNLIYRKNNDNYNLYCKIIEKFNNTKKIKNFSIIRNKILYRSEYLFLDRKVYSINFKG